MRSIFLVFLATLAFAAPALADDCGKPIAPRLVVVCVGPPIVPAADPAAQALAWRLTHDGRFSPRRLSDRSRRRVLPNAKAPSTLAAAPPF